MGEQLGRARAGDRVVLYFAGYGTATPEGRPALLFRDASASRDSGLATVAALGRALAGGPGEKLFVVDAGFGGGSRSIGAAALPRGDPGRLDVTTLLAAGPGEGALSPAHLGHGLLTYRLLEALRRARGGGPAIREMFPRIQASVEADAELLGTRQAPRLVEAGAFHFLAH